MRETAMTCRRQTGRCDPGETQNNTSRAGRHRFRGNLETGRRRYRRCEKPGQPDRFATGTAEGCESRGDPVIHHRQSRKMHDEGQPEECIRRRRT